MTDTKQKKLQRRSARRLAKRVLRIDAALMSGADTVPANLVRAGLLRDLEQISDERHETDDLHELRRQWR